MKRLLFAIFNIITIYPFAASAQQENTIEVGIQIIGIGTVYKDSSFVGRNTAPDVQIRIDNKTYPQTIYNISEEVQDVSDRTMIYKKKIDIDAFVAESVKSYLKKELKYTTLRKLSDNPNNGVVNLGKQRKYSLKILEIDDFLDNFKDPEYLYFRDIERHPLTIPSVDAFNPETLSFEELDSDNDLMDSRKTEVKIKYTISSADYRRAKNRLQQIIDSYEPLITKIKNKGIYCLYKVITDNNPNKMYYTGVTFYTLPNQLEWNDFATREEVEKSLIFLAHDRIYYNFDYSAKKREQNASKLLGKLRGNLPCRKTKKMSEAIRFTNSKLSDNLK